MSKFYIQCNACGRYHEAKTGIFFGTRTIKCECGNEINVKKDRYISINCPHCKNIVTLDQAKRNEALCPVCHKHLNSESRVVEVHCPTCDCLIEVDKDQHDAVCPLCDTHFDIEKEKIKESLKKSSRISIIKYEGPNNVLAWKHPIEDFVTGSKLIVHESQVACFLRDGELFDIFQPGEHILTTDKLPLLTQTFVTPTNQNVENFHSEIYFVNLATQLGLKWGTPSKIGLFDPHSGMHVEIGACGQYNLNIIDPAKFLKKFLGLMAF